jgi:hypothetical protein
MTLEERKIGVFLRFPLHWAAINGNEKHAGLLLKRGCVLDERMRCVLDVNEEGRRITGSPYLVLPEEEVDCDEEEASFTLLEFATMYGRAVVKTLIELGANVLRPALEASGVESATEKTPIALCAIQMNWPEVFEVFWRHSEKTRRFPGLLERAAAIAICTNTKESLERLFLLGLQRDTVLCEKTLLEMAEENEASEEILA